MCEVLIVSTCSSSLEQVSGLVGTPSSSNRRIRTAAIEDASRYLPYSDLIVLVHNQFDRSTRQFLENCRESTPDTPVIVAALPRDEDLVVRYLLLGASGYLFAGAPPESLERVAKAARKGQLLVDATTATALVQQISTLREQLQRAGYYRFRGDPVEVLTERERDILKLIAREGLSNRAIADRLFIEIGTVKNHVHSILRKLGVHNREQAVRFYYADTVPAEGSYGAEHLPRHSG